MDPLIDQIQKARYDTYVELSAIWKSRNPKSAIRPCPLFNRLTCEGQQSLVSNFESTYSQYSLVDYIGRYYTTRLPPKMRAKNGVYYTPSSLVEHTIAGVDCKRFVSAKHRALDPACGVGVFLVGFVHKLIDSVEKSFSERDIIKLVSQRVCGFDSDEFACWVSQVMIDDALLQRLQINSFECVNVVSCQDSLRSDIAVKYDVVMGNPPYGKVTLDSQIKASLGSGVFGHANLYGLFIHKALTWLSDEGVLLFVVPSSFLSGLYFKNLRAFIGQSYTVTSIDVITSRKGVFKDVLQEALVVNLAKSREEKRTRISSIEVLPTTVNCTEVGDVAFFGLMDKPWIVPKQKEDMLLLAHLPRFTLKDYGFTVSTGPLVWNRCKGGLMEQPEGVCFPVIWSESILSDGSFSLAYAKRKDKTWFKPDKDTPTSVLTSKPAVIIKRTSSKEQSRRVCAALLPESVFERYGAVVIENHVNYITSNSQSLVEISLLYRLICSSIFEQLITCISGSVSVSSYELMNVPLPSPEELKKIQFMSNDHFEAALLELYKI